jgi:hypothetical protein
MMVQPLSGAVVTGCAYGTSSRRFVLTSFLLCPSRVVPADNRVAETGLACLGSFDYTCIARLFLFVANGDLAQAPLD